MFHYNWRNIYYVKHFHTILSSSNFNGRNTFLRVRFNLIRLDSQNVIVIGNNLLFRYLYLLNFEFILFLLSRPSRTLLDHSILRQIFQIMFCFIACISLLDLKKRTYFKLQITIYCVKTSDNFKFHLNTARGI